MKSFGPIKLNWSDGQTGSFLWWPAIPGGAGAQTSGTWKSKKYCNSSIGGLSGKQNLSKQHIEVISHDMLTSSSGYLKSVFDAANELHNNCMNDQKGLNSIIILGAWSLWNHRNRCVFDGCSPSLTSAAAIIKEEARQWSIAGARGVSHLLALAAPAT